MADKTLDEIIKQKRIKRFNASQQTGRVTKTAAPKGNMMNKKGRLFKEVQKDLGITNQKKAVTINTDARNRIIQNKRVKYRDARDRLAQIAKQGDARDKLNKMRKTNPGSKKGQVIPQQQKNVPKKKNTNVPKQPSRTGQIQTKGVVVRNVATGGGIVRSVPVKMRTKPAVVKNGVVARSRQQNRPQQPHRTLPIANNPSVITIKNNNAQLYDAYSEDVTDYRQELQIAPRSQHFGGMGVPAVAYDEMVTGRSQQFLRSRPTESIYVRDYEPELRPSRLRITAANTDYRLGGQQYVEDWQPEAWAPPPRMQQRKRELYDEQLEYQAYPKKFSIPSQPQAQQGTKVVVSNLHPCVSVEDMEELFGTIGSVLSVRMVRQGVAEAIFVGQDDAYRSVDLFNNRQLDGQPMKVVVIKKKTPLMTNPPLQSRSVLKSARGRTGYYVQ